MSYPNMYVETDLATHLCQGDIFLRLPGEVLPDTHPPASAFMMLTYTCDLVNTDDVAYITVCPVFKLEYMYRELVRMYKERTLDNRKREVLARLHNLSENKKRFYFFLTPSPDYDSEPAYADLAQVFSLTSDNIPIILDKRTRSLKSPWREKLGFMLGYLYNRVATEDIAKESIEKYVLEEKGDILTNLED